MTSESHPFARSPSSALQSAACSRMSALLGIIGAMAKLALTCPTCKRAFEVYPSLAARYRHCSVACRAAATNRRGRCPQCGRDFVTKTSSRRSFCSRACALRWGLERGSFGRRPKASWPPCAACGDPGGWVAPGDQTPRRTSGARFGVAGRLCQRCYVRLYDAERRGGRRPARSG